MPRTDPRSSRHGILRAVALLSVLLPGEAALGDGIDSVEGFAGTAINLHTPLTIRQDGEPDLHISAHYDTRPLEDPWYYAFRVEFRSRAATWGIQNTHHKLFLTNPPDEVQHFEITHGFNLFTAHRTFLWKGGIYRVGGGIVLAHAESTVRHRSSRNGGGILGTGYHLTGPVVVLGAGKRISIGSHAFVAVEAQVIGAYVRVPVNSGTATAWTAGLHALAGMGYGF